MPYEWNYINRDLLQSYKVEGSFVFKSVSMFKTHFVFSEMYNLNEAFHFSFLNHGFICKRIRISTFSNKGYKGENKYIYINLYKDKRNNMLKALEYCFGI